MIKIPLFSIVKDADHNVGDMFIGWGVRHLIQEALNYEADFHVIEKHDYDDFEKKKWLLEQEKLLVLAGMPQYNNLSDWRFWYDDVFYTELATIDGMRLIKLGGGSGHFNVNMTPKEFSAHLRSDQRTVNIARLWQEYSPIVTVRDSHSHQYLNDLGIDNRLMICPALFAYKYVRMPVGLVNPGKSKVFIVPPSFRSLATIYDRNKIAKAFENCYKILSSNYPCIVSIHHTDDYQYIKENGLFKDANIFYSNSALAVMAQYTGSIGVVSGKLHGAIPIYGMGCTKVVHVGVDTRWSAVNLLKNAVNLSCLEITGEKLAESFTNCEPSSYDEIEKLRSDYINFLKSRFDIILKG